MPRLKQIGIDVEVNGVIENNRHSFSESENDILRRLLLGATPERKANNTSETDFSIVKEQTRARGRWTVERGSKRAAAANLKDAYRVALLTLNDEFPDFLDKFAQEQSRARRFVAKSPVELYFASPALARHHAKPLVDGWFFDTNLSTDQVARRVRIAARICGLRYGSEFQILNNFEQI